MRLVKIEGKVTRAYTVGEVALVVGRDKSTIKRWEREGWFPPPYYRLQYGNVAWRMYTEDEVKAIREGWIKYMTGPRKRLDVLKQCILEAYKRHGLMHVIQHWLGRIPEDNDKPDVPGVDLEELFGETSPNADNIEELSPNKEG